MRRLLETEVPGTARPYSPNAYASATLAGLAVPLLVIAGFLVAALLFGPLAGTIAATGLALVARRRRFESRAGWVPCERTTRPDGS